MKKNNKKGFTLLEVLVSIIIVGIVLTCVVILTNASTEASSKSRLNNNISFKIEGILDEFSVDPTSVREGRIYFSITIRKDILSYEDIICLDISLPQ